MFQYSNSAFYLAGGKCSTSGRCFAPDSQSLAAPHKYNLKRSDNDNQRRKIKETIWQRPILIDFLLLLSKSIGLHFFTEKPQKLSTLYRFTASKEANGES